MGVVIEVVVWCVLLVFFEIVFIGNVDFGGVCFYLAG